MTGSDRARRRSPRRRRSGAVGAARTRTAERRLSRPVPAGSDHLWSAGGLDPSPPTRPARCSAPHVVVVVGCSALVVAAVHPDLVLRNTTPTGGDMGAHVWGPAS